MSKTRNREEKGSSFRSGEFDPLGDIPVLEIVSGSYTVGDMIFDTGKVIHDYLKQPEKNQ
jgi:acetoacetate decarboxylase